MNKLMKKLDNYLEENEISWEKFVKDYQYTGFRDSNLAIFLSEIDGKEIDFYVQECSEDGDYWLEAKISVERNKKYYYVTFDSDYGFNLDSKKDFIQGIIDTEREAQEAKKVFKE